MGRVLAADYIGFSPGFFDKMVVDGRMPKPRRVGSRLVWLRDELEAALRSLPAEGNDDGLNEWDTAA
jgi:predicted DNA-binding transcriptional regulator AlpA